MGKVLPSETAARACVAKLASQKEEQIQELLRDKNIFLIVDEAEVAEQKYIIILHQTGYVSTIKLSLFSGAMSFKSMKYIHQPTMHSSR